MAVQVHTDKRPVQTCGHLFNVGGLTRPMIALHHHTTIIFKTRQNGAGCLRVETIGIVKVGRITRALGKSRYGPVHVNAENIANVGLAIRLKGHQLIGLIDNRHELLALSRTLKHAANLILRSPADKC